jgi:hypothetical protein
VGGRGGVSTDKMGQHETLAAWLCCMPCCGVLCRSYCAVANYAGMWLPQGLAEMSSVCCV